MKHVFGISSHLTFYICNHYIELQNLSKEDCILFLTRSYQIPTQYDKIYPLQIHTDYNVHGTNVGRVFAGADFVRTRKNIQRFDEIIDDFLQNDAFFWYAQVCSNDVFSMMATKKNCVGYYIIEDGLASYRNYNPQTFTGLRSILYHALLKPLWPRIFALKNHFISTESPKFQGCIATSSNCFPLHREKLIVIGNPFENVELPVKPDAIISVDSWYLFTSDLETIRAIYRKVASFMKGKDYTHVYYKFHPNLYNEKNTEIKETYRAILQEAFPFQMMELDSAICIENVLKSYACDFYSSSSSVALYCNNHCFSYANIMRRHHIDVDIPAACEDRFIQI